MTTKTILRQVHATQRGVIHYYLKVDGATGNLDGPDSLQFSSVRNGAGDYSLSLLDEAGEEDLLVFVQSEESGVHVQRPASVTSSSFDVLSFSDLAETTPADASMSLLVVKRSRADKY
jgi:hypothetical protein